VEELDNCKLFNATLERQYEELENSDKCKFFLVEDMQLLNRSIHKGKTAIIGNYDNDSGEYARRVLVSLGFKVKVVRHGEEIIKQFQCGKRYDLVVSNSFYAVHKDFDVMSGEKFVLKMKYKEKFEVPIVACCVELGEGKRKKYLEEYGFDGYLKKFFTQTDAIKELERVFAKK